MTCLEQKVKLNYLQGNKHLNYSMQCILMLHPEHIITAEINISFFCITAYV